MKLLKPIFVTLSLLSFLGMLIGIETSLWFGLLLIPFAVFMYLGDGCYECFYDKPKKPARKRIREERKADDPNVKFQEEVLATCHQTRNEAGRDKDLLCVANKIANMSFNEKVKY